MLQNPAQQPDLVSFFDNLLAIEEHELKACYQDSANRLSHPDNEIHARMMVLHELIEQIITGNYATFLPRLAESPDRPFNRMVNTLARRERILKELIDILADEAAENVLARKKLQKEADISKLHKETLFQVASIDPLTGLANRRLLKELVNQTIADSRRNTAKFALLFIDLDNFKPVNDTHGHTTGDMLLSVIAARLKRLLRESDIVARYGGDEFVAVIKSVKNRNQAGFVASKILAHISKPVNVNGVTCSVQASVGIAMFPEKGPDIETLIEAADLAMYDIKKSGKNGYAFA